MLKGCVHMKMRSLVRLMLVMGGLMATYISPAYALVEININKGNVQPLPIAITDFISNGDLGAQISGVIAADLKAFGAFRADRQGRVHREDHQS